MEKNIVFCVDNRYVDQLDVAIKSLIAHNAQLNIYVVNTDIPAEYFMKYHNFLFGTTNRVIDWKISEANLKWDASFKYITKISYARMLLPDLLPQDINRVLYLDCDVVVNANLDELFRIDLNGKSLGMAVDWFGYKTPTNRYNSGVILFDCDVWRQNNYVDGLKKETERRVAYIEHTDKEIRLDEQADDQHIFNAYFDYDSIYELAPEYNMAFGLETFELSQEAKEKFLQNKRKIIHFAGQNKPWIWMRNTNGRQEWWMYHEMSVRDALAMYQENQAQKQVLVFTLTENIRGIEQIAKQCPQVSFLIAAPTEVTFKVLRLNAHPNIFVKKVFIKENFNYDKVKAVLMLGEGSNNVADQKFFNQRELPVLTYQDLALEGVEYAYQATSVDEMIAELNLRVEN